MAGVADAVVVGLSLGLVFVVVTVVSQTVVRLGIHLFAKGLRFSRPQSLPAEPRSTPGTPGNARTTQNYIIVTLVGPQHRKRDTRNDLFVPCTINFINVMCCVSLTQDTQKQTCVALSLA